MQVFSESVGGDVHHVGLVLEEVVYGAVTDVLPGVEVAVDRADVLHAALAVHEVERVAEARLVSAPDAQSQPSGTNIY